MSLLRDHSQLRPSAGIAIVVNGAESFVDRGATVAHLLDRLGIASGRVAVEINLTVIDREAFGTTHLQEGDRVEIVSFVGGGYG
jgi:thiamine biosynthesis protein ThiS